MVIIVAILTLDLISAKRKGLATIRGRTDLVSSLFLEQGLLWTTLPPLLMALYKLIWGSAVSACSQRQPFIELAKDQGNGAPAKNSILLDYRSYSTFLSWFIAFQNGHYLIGISILFSLILSIFVVPLSAYLFTPGTIISSTTVQLNMTTSFNESAITSHTDLAPVFEAASATSIYNGYPQPWTNRK